MQRKHPRPWGVFFVLDKRNVARQQILRRWSLSYMTLFESSIRVLLRIALLICILLFSLASAQADHGIGGDITYTCLGNGKYLLTLKVYRDCKGIQVGQEKVMARSANTTVNVYSQTKIGVRDITSYYNSCQTGSRCNGVGIVGTEEHTWQMTLDLSSYSDCEWTLIWEQCCRQSMTTVNSSGGLVIEAKLNKCVSPCDNSPVFNQNAGKLAYLCQGKEFVYDFGATDSLDGDSLSYHLVTPRISASNYVTYQQSFSATRPITFMGFPAATLPSPWGLHLDSVGELRFTPAVLNQSGIINVEVRQWRMINGNMQVIGSIYRNMIYMVVDCPDNVPPVISAPKSIKACVGDKVCIPILTSDANTYDSVKLSWNQGIAAATFTHTNGAQKRAQGEICWTPTAGDISTQPHRFTVSATDDYCSNSFTTTDTFEIWVANRDSSVQAVLDVQNTGCGIYRIDHTLPYAYPGYQSHYVLRDSLHRIVWISELTTDSIYLKPGNYSLSFNASADNFCYSSQVQAINVAGIDSFGQHRNYIFCLGGSEELSLPPRQGDSIPTYSWYWEDLTQQVHYLGKRKTWTIQSGYLGPFFAQANHYNCFIKDTLDITWHQTPYVKINNVLDHGCISEPMEFTADTSFNPTPIASHKWYLGDGDSSEFLNLIHFYTQAGTYLARHKTISQQGCVHEDTLIVTLEPEIVLDPLADYQLRLYDSASFNVGFYHPLAAYQWLVDTGQGFIPLLQSAFPVVGVKDRYLFIYNVIKSLDKAKFMCRVQLLNCEAFSDTGSIALVPGLGMESIAQPQLTIFPSPTAGQLFIRYPDWNSRLEMELTNTAGQVLKRFSLEGKEQSLSLSDLPAGLYFIRFKDNLSEAQPVLKQ
ncbi:MAG: T9SS type A sorting domain-containing protein [Bacteroidetes bacterium]|nr:MAG: T9SS type A sorting domain-containing protein [Bacteroidota bacterium]